MKVIPYFKDFIKSDNSLMAVMSVFHLPREKHREYLRDLSNTAVFKSYQLSCYFGAIKNQLIKAFLRIK